jgi:hypothetical protein
LDRHLLLGLEQPASLLLRKVALEDVAEGEEVHLRLKLKENIFHEDPLVLLNFEDKTLVFALGSLLPQGDSFLVSNYSFVSFDDAFFAEGLSAWESSQSPESMTPKLNLSRYQYESRIRTKQN